MKLIKKLLTFKPGSNWEERRWKQLPTWVKKRMEDTPSWAGKATYYRGNTFIYKQKEDYGNQQGSGHNEYNYFRKKRKPLKKCGGIIKNF